jgi:sugar lactone lactonase YvrE
MIGWSNFRFGFSVLRTGKKITKELKKGRRSTMSRAFSTRFSARLVVFLATACLAAGLPIQEIEKEIIPFVPERWDLAGAKVVDHLERQALIGTAVLKDVEFEDGTIECEITMKAGTRSYPGILFRFQSEEEDERVYLRPHRSPLYDDAVQYVAAFHGIDSWQLYNGPGLTARAVIPTDRWVPVRIEVQGTQARIFLDNAPQPVLVIGDLKHGKSRGRIGLTTVPDGTAFFSNFSFRRGASLVFPPAPLVHQPPGCVRDWEISEPLKRLRIDFDSYPDAKALGVSSWTKVSAQPDGVLDFSRTYGRRGAEPDAILARAVIQADKEGPKKFWLGYSDEASLFVNGRLVFYGDSTYRSRDSSFLGILGLFDAVSLPLQKGANEILFIIGEAFGGWGLILQDATFVRRAPGVEALWTTGRDFFIPESAAYDPGTDAFYVSNYDGYNPSRGSGRQHISKLTADGKAAALQWVSGLNNPTGLAVWKDRLYAVERAGLVEIDIPSAKILKRIAIPGAAFPNDIAVDDGGDMFVSDSRKNSIFRISAGQVEEWLTGPSIEAPNGIYVLRGKLIIGTNGDGCLKAVDLATKEVSTLVNLGQGIIDGIASDGEGNLLVSHNEGRLFKISPDGRVTTILDTTALRMNMADFGYAPGLDMIVFPTYTDNRVAAFRLGR